MTIRALLTKITPLWAKNHGTAREEILGLHESADKLYVAYSTHDRQRVRKGVSNALIGILSIAKTLGIKDLDRLIAKRVADLERKLQ